MTCRWTSYLWVRAWSLVVGRCPPFEIVSGICTSICTPCSEDFAITSSGEAQSLWQLVVGSRIIVLGCIPMTRLPALAHHCSQRTERIALDESVVFTGPHGEAY